MDVVLLPGLLCDAVVWADVVPRLRDVANCTIAHSPERSLAAMARRALDIAPPSFALAGHSMGARVAYEMLRQAPERITRLALFDTGYRAATPDERPRRLALLDLARSSGMRAMASEWMRPMVHSERLNDSKLVEAIVEMAARHTPEDLAAQIDALLERPDAEALLRSIRIPTLVACGRNDAWSPLQQHREIARLVARSRLVVFDDCGHMSPMERPDAVAEALLEWLAPQGAARSTASIDA
jgi:pimeloyl-ACP methyl ester carboxylesterase